MVTRGLPGQEAALALLLIAARQGIGSDWQLCESALSKLKGRSCAKGEIGGCRKEADRIGCSPSSSSARSNRGKVYDTSGDRHSMSLGGDA